jgi:hypothetical protein
MAISQTELLRYNLALLSFGGLVALKSKESEHGFGLVWNAQRSANSTKTSGSAPPQVLYRLVMARLKTLC